MKRVITSSTNFITAEDAAKDTAMGMDVPPAIISELKDTALFSHAYSAILTILRQNERINKDFDVNDEHINELLVNESEYLAYVYIIDTLDDNQPTSYESLVKIHEFEVLDYLGDML